MEGWVDWLVVFQTYGGNVPLYCSHRLSLLPSNASALRAPARHLPARPPAAALEGAAGGNHPRPAPRGWQHRPTAGQR